MAKRASLEDSSDGRYDFQENFGDSQMQQEAASPRWEYSSNHVSTIYQRSHPKNEKMQLHNFMDTDARTRSDIKSALADDSEKHVS